MSQLPAPDLTSGRDRRTARAYDGWLTTRIRAAAARRRKAAVAGGKADPLRGPGSAERMDGAEWAEDGDATDGLAAG